MTALEIASVPAAAAPSLQNCRRYMINLLELSLISYYSLPIVNTPVPASDPEINFGYISAEIFYNLWNNIKHLLTIINIIQKLI
jgi:hypothetical protein